MKKIYLVFSIISVILIAFVELIDNVMESYFNALIIAGGQPLSLQTQISIVDCKNILVGVAVFCAVATIVCEIIDRKKESK